MTSTSKVKFLISALSAAFFLSGCNSDVQIFREKVVEGEQVRIKSSELENQKFYVKDGTDFILTLPPKGSATSIPDYSSLSSTNKKRVLYARPNEDTLIPTHYKGEIIAQASEDDEWQSVFLERFKDMGYSVGFYNADYDREKNELSFELGENGLKETDFYEKTSDLESKDIRIVEVNHKPLSEENADFDSGILIGMEQGESVNISFYAGTYYHEMDIIADTQMFQSFEMYSYDSTYIADTPNGYRSFVTPENLKSGYYSINALGLFRYVDYKKGQGNIEETAYNEKFYESDEDMLSQFSSKYSFTVEARIKNLTVAALYDEESIEDEELIEGYIFAPDGTQYNMNLDTKKHTLRTDFTEVMPGKWTVNIVPKTLEIKNFDVVNNSPDEELTQKEYILTFDENKENIVFKCYFKSKVNESLDDIDVTGSIVSPNGETYVMQKDKEKDLEGNEKMFLYYIMPFAEEGNYTVDINYYPEKAEVEEPFTQNNTETVTDIIVIDG